MTRHISRAWNATKLQQSPMASSTSGPPRRPQTALFLQASPWGDVFAATIDRIAEVQDERAKEGAQ